MTATGPPSPAPLGALCPHFGECGGCRTQDLAYPEQLARKADELAGLLGPFGGASVAVLPSPRVWHYRNKVELSFAPKQYPQKPPPGFVRETVLGFKRRGRWFWTLDLEDCLIGPPGLGALMAAVRGWLRRAGLSAYDGRRGTGLLRHLVVREGTRTGQRLVTLVTGPGGLDDPGGFVDAVRQAWPDVSGVCWGVQSAPADHAVAETIERLAGLDHITERLEVPTSAGTRPLGFRVSPYSFLQTNTLAAEVLYGRIRAWVEAVAPRTLYDLYGGAGGIALACSDLVERVVSVESWEPASLDGAFNAGANGVVNVGFVTAPVERYLGTCVDEGAGLDETAAVVLDPPRSGLHPKALRALRALRPPRILYVSCNPGALARELVELGTAYELVDAFAVDLFPHTPHVEAVVHLERRRGA